MIVNRKTWLSLNADERMRNLLEKWIPFSPVEL
jgi:hypothetical protein